MARAGDAEGNHLYPHLLLEAQLFYERTVCTLVVCLKVFQVLTSISNKTQKTATRVLILGILGQMSRKLLNATGKDSNLHLRRTGIGVVALNLDDFVLFLSLGKHAGIVAH